MIDVSEPNMDGEPDNDNLPNNRPEVRRILEKVDSIHDFTESVAEELRATQIGRFWVEKFQVTFFEWVEWSLENPDAKVEYDAQRNYLVIKATETPLHERTTSTIHLWMSRVLAEDLSAATGLSFTAIETTPSVLAGDHTGGSKYPDAGVVQDVVQDDNLYPLVALEVAVCESTDKVFKDAVMWLQGSKGHTRLVIVVDIKEHFPKDIVKTRDWDLSDEEILEADKDDLYKKVLQWHEKNKAPLIGKFTADIYFCTEEQPRKRVWKCEFSQDGPKVNLLTKDSDCYIDAKDLLPELDKSCHSHIRLPLEDISNAMRNSLELHEASRALNHVSEGQKALLMEKEIRDQ